MTLVAKIKNKIYFLYAMLASLAFAIHNYSIAYAMQRWRNSSTVLYSECFMLISFWAFYHWKLAAYINKGLVNKQIAPAMEEKCEDS
jgi:hypothetical protein